MVTKVNPPPHVPIPESVKKDPALLKYFQANERILFQLYTRSGGSEDLIDQAAESSTLNSTAQLNTLNARIGSGNILTIDTSGFTIDTSKQFTEQVNA